MCAAFYEKQKPAAYEPDDSPLFERISKEIVDRIDRTKEIADEEVLALIDEKLLDKEQMPYMPLGMKKEFRMDLFNSLRRLGIIQELLDDETVTEIMVNGTERIFIEKDGVIRQWHKRFSSRKKLEDMIQQIVSKTNRRVNQSSPIVDTRLENGARINVVMAPIALNGPIVTIRRFPAQPIRMADLISWGSISTECAAFLKVLVMAGYNIFVSGGTGSGKTTFLNVLSDYIPGEERVITIEDSAELQLLNLPNLVRMETRTADMQGENELTVRDLIKSALRMRPDRIVVGEVRGAEAIDMLQAFNTGHDGSLSTGHANSPADMLARLETMVLMGMEIPLEAVRRQIASGIDIIVHLGRMRDKSRRVLEVTEVIDYEQGEIVTAPLFVFREEKKEADIHNEQNEKTNASGKSGREALEGIARGSAGASDKSVRGKLVRVGRLTHRRKLQAAGLMPEEGEL